MIEENKIYNADCLDILKELPDKCIDLVLTDPSYGIGRFGDRVEISNRIDKTAKINKWDKKRQQNARIAGNHNGYFEIGMAIQALEWVLED